jgi:PD-(D/E)XK nuclease superfamily
MGLRQAVGLGPHCKLPAARRLEYVTPSGAPGLEGCLLRAAYGSDPEFAREVPSSPAARLGNVCHRVLELAGAGALQPAPDHERRDSFETVWREAIESELDRSRANPLERHWPDPERWHGYSMRKVATRHLAHRVATAVAETAPAPGHGRGTESPQILHEHSQAAFAGRLRGRADVIRRNGTVRIEDYKTGSIFEEGTDELKVSYRKQLLLYAVLEQAESGIWPSQASLIPLEGEPETIEVDPDEALASADIAIAALDRYNSAISHDDALPALGNPSHDACRFCPFASRCPAFWSAIDPSWGEAGILVVSGTLISLYDSRQDTFTIEIAVAAGSVSSGICLIRGLDNERFAAVREADNSAAIAATWLLGDPQARQFKAGARTRIVLTAP